MMHDDFPEHMRPREEPAGTVLHLEVDDADKWWERALAAGAEVTFPIGNQFWGARLRSAPAIRSATPGRSLGPLPRAELHQGMRLPS